MYILGTVHKTLQYYNYDISYKKGITMWSADIMHNTLVQSLYTIIIAMAIQSGQMIKPLSKKVKRIATTYYNL